jgi:hypothetical protein
MAFALDNRRAGVAVLGSCGYAGGLSVISLDSGRKR